MRRIVCFYLTCMVSLTLCGCSPLIPPRVFYSKHFIYGRVLDQHGEPVTNLTLRASWFGPPDLYPMSIPLGRKVLVTDASGQWEVMIRERLDSDLSVRPVSLPPGYDSLAGRSAVLYGLDRTKTTPDNRVTLYLRRRSEGTVLLPGNVPSLPQANAFYVSPERPTREFDFLRMDWTHTLYKTPDAPKPAGFYVDVAMTVHWKEKFPNAAQREPRAWIVFSALNPGDGLIVTDELLFTAPADGYRSTGEFRLQVRQAVGYLYVRSRNPPLYSRMGFHLSSDWDRVRFNIGGIMVPAGGGLVTNPYGDRDLEQAENVPPALRARLEKEAREALAAGRLPEKPDLKALIEGIQGGTQ